MNDFLDKLNRLFWTVVLFAVFCLLAGMAGNALVDLLTRPSLTEVNRGLTRLATFKKTQGIVDEVKIWRLSDAKRPRFAATVSYHFEIEGRTYPGDCLSLDRCIFMTKRFGGVQDALHRVRRYFPEHGPTVEGKGSDPRLGNSAMAFTAYASNVKTEILYDPQHPETSVLDNDEYEALFFYSGTNPTLQPLHWSDYYGAPIFITFFFSLVSMAMLWAICRLLRIRMPFSSTRQLLVTYHPETKVFVHRFQSPSHDAILKVLGIFAIFCGYATWRAGLQKTTMDLALGSAVGLSLAAFGVVLFSFRRTVEIRVAEQTVVHIQRLWLLVHTLAFQKSWRFSDFDRVQLQTQFVQARGTSIGFWELALGFSGSAKKLSLVVQEGNTTATPALLADYAEEVSKVMGLPLQSPDHEGK